MATTSQSDRLLMTRVRAGQSEAWNELIARYEGRLLAFVESRVGRRHASEDVVQETFVGFLRSLPNYDDSRSLESYLFSIAAHKLADHLRREGRRPALPLAPPDGESDFGVPAPQRSAGSLLQSGERRSLEAAALATALREILEQWRAKNDWTRIQCQEMLHVRGLSNNEVARRLGLSEQQVASHKFEFLARLRTALRNQGLNADVFPELSAT